MLLEFFNLTSYYWPRLLAGLWFSVFNIYVFNKYGKKNEHILRDGIILFLISSGFLSIIGEDVFEKLYYSVGNLLSIRDESNFFFIATSMVGDSITVFLGGMFFTYYTNKKNFLGAAIYLQYVCLERLCSIVAINQLTYILLYILFMGFLYAIQKKDLPFLFSSTTVSWRRIYLYLIGLFYVLDLLYGAYYIFPELPYSGRFSHYALWLNAVALLNSAFVAGYIKANYSIAREHDKKIKYMKKLQNSQEDIIIALAEISEAKSGETGQHIRRVAEYSKLVAEEMGLSLEEIETIRIAAMMHDIGKLMIDKNILEKPGTLTELEYESIKEHTRYGGELLSKNDGYLIKMAREIAVQHHERWNGNGYPANLKGNDISIYAQIVSVTDVYDALTSKRSYKESWEPSVARKEIIDQRGKQFSPKVVDAFITCYDKIEEVRTEYSDAV